MSTGRMYVKADRHMDLEVVRWTDNGLLVRTMDMELQVTGEVVGGTGRTLPRQATYTK